MKLIEKILVLFLCVTINVESFRIKEKQIIRQDTQKQSQQNCKIPTNFQYRNLEYIQKNTWMRSTFFKIQMNFPYMDGPTWSPDNDTNYKIVRVILNYNYKDQNQTAKFGQNDLILIEGGYLQTSFNFDVYIRKQSDLDYQKKLIVKAYATSRQILYSLYPNNPDQKYFMSTLAFKQVSNIVFDEFEITSIEPEQQGQNATDQDIDTINRMLYKGGSDLITIKFDLQRQLNKNVRINLPYYIHSTADSASSVFYTKYTWINIHSSNYLEISPYKANTFIRFQKTTNQGIYYSYSNKIYNLTNQICDSSSIMAPLDTKIYGTKQEFISYSFYRNMIMYALQNDVLDTILNRTIWATKSFRYYAGQLFPILSDLDKKFYSNAEVNGSCKAIPLSLSVGKGKNSAFRVNLDYSCDILVQNIKVIQFNTSLQLDVQGVPVNQSIDFQAKDINSKTVYDDSFGFKLINRTIVDQLVNQAVNRLFEESLFGSGWPVFLKRQNPQFIVLQNTTLVYDKAQVKNQQTYQQ